MLRLRVRRFVLIGLTAIATLAVLAFAALWFTLPSVADLHQRAQTPSTRILDRNGRLLYEIGDPRIGHHTPLPLQTMPLRLRQATIAVEDASFYTNPGVDVLGILRALWINIRGGEALAGGSTITQQLARLLLLDAEERQQRTLLRKARESVLAWQITQRYSKDEVLALYLNEVYYGNLAYGVEAASHAYFNKSASELDLAESALLAGLPQSPVYYDPYIDFDLARQRQAIVLDLMARNGSITEAEAITAKATQLNLAPAPYNIRAPHFVSYVRHWLEDQFGTEAVVRGGLIVTTTLDLALNDAATQIMRVRLGQLAEPQDGQPAANHNANNAALIALSPTTGEIIAMVGSPNYFDAQISGAVNAATSLRQPGSAIKPITYAAAFARLPNFTAATPLFDVRTAFPTREGLPYVPVNYDRQHHGPISVRDALATSNNVAAVSVLHQLGLDAMLTQANAMGIHTFRDANDYGLALTLGGGEVKLVELTAAFGTFANTGRRVEPIAVKEVRTAVGEVLFLPSPVSRPPSMLDPRLAWLITDILADNTARAPAFGEGSVLRLSRPAAVKTGTTQDWRDNWTVGYTPDLVTGVWVGNADGRPMHQISGVAGAGPIWHDFMELAQRGKPVVPFTRPDGLRAVQVCTLSGQLPTPACAHTRTEWFIDGTQPTQPDTWYKLTQIDALTNRPATPNTPRERIVERVLLDVPLPLRDWAREAGWLLWEPSGGGMGNGVGAVPGELDAALPLAITQPDDGSVYRISKELPLEVQRIPLQVSASADVARVDIVLGNGETIAQLPHAPFISIWQMKPGDYTLIARATLHNGRVLESTPVSIRIYAP